MMPTHTATASGAVGIGRAALGDPAGAVDAFEESLHTSGEHLVMFRCWGHARLALVMLDANRLAEAATHVRQALASGLGPAQYEARLARCELAVRRADDDAGALVQEALSLAVDGGHAVTAVRLEQLRRLVS